MFKKEVILLGLLLLVRIVLSIMQVLIDYKLMLGKYSVNFMVVRNAQTVVDTDVVFQAITFDNGEIGAVINDDTVKKDRKSTRLNSSHL